jgi:phage terminase large subunit-like protein
MGLRGVWAGVRRENRELVESRPARRLPWLKKGLTRVQRIIAFLEFLPITKGRLVGERMKLLPDQRRFVEEVYGSRREVPVRIAVKSEARGNGKTGLLAGLALCHLLGPESELRGEVFSAAIDRQQAGIMFTEMEAIIMAVPEFAARCNVQRFHKKIEIVEDGPGKGSTYEALSADARRAHGLAPTLWVYDELAQAKDRTLLDNLQTAMGKRKHSLGIIISTQAADDEHPLSQIIDDGLTGVDPGVVVHLTAAANDADPFDEAVIASVNPAFGKFLSAADVFAEAERARRMPSFEPAFRNLRLNQRIQAFDRVGLCRPDVWAKGDPAIDEGLFTDGRPVYGGLDLSSRVDLTALVLAVEDDDERLHLKPYVFTPRDTLRDREERDRVPYDAWARQGHLIAVPGTAIDYDWIAQTLAEVTGTMNVVKIHFDRWRIEILNQALARLGYVVPLIPFGQGYQSMSPAIEAFEEYALPGRIVHGGHPVLRWCVGNTAIELDAARNRKPTKAKSWGRIDAAVAAVMAIAAAKCSTEPVLDVAGMIG